MTRIKYKHIDTPYPHIEDKIQPVVDSYSSRKSMMELYKETYLKYYNWYTMKPLPRKSNGPNSEYLFDKVPNRISPYLRVDGDLSMGKFVYWTYHISCYTRHIEAEYLAVSDVINSLIDAPERNEGDFELLKNLFFMLSFDLVLSYSIYIRKYNYRDSSARYETMYHMAEELYFTSMKLKLRSPVGFLKRVSGQYYWNMIHTERRGDIRYASEDLKDNIDYQYSTRLMSGMVEEDPDHIYDIISQESNLETLFKSAGTRILDKLISKLKTPFDEKDLYYLKRSVLLSKVSNTLITYGLSDNYKYVVKRLLNSYQIESLKIFKEIVKNPTVDKEIPEFNTLGGVSGIMAASWDESGGVIT